MKLERHNKNGKKYNIKKDFRGGHRRFYRRHDGSQQDRDCDVSSDVSSDVSNSLHELSIEVKYLYITRKMIFDD